MGAPSGPIGVEHVCVATAVSVPLVDPYGAVDATSPGGQGAGWVVGVDTGVHSAAHV